MTKLSGAAIAWGAGRGLSIGTLQRIGAVSGTASMPDGTQGEVIVFPYRRGKETVNWKARGLAEKAWKQKPGGELRFFNLDAILAANPESVYITEGELDAAALVEAGIPLKQVTSVPNGAPQHTADHPEELNRYRFVDAALKEGLGKIKRYVLATDNDAPGLALRQDLIRLLGPAKCWFVEWPAEIKDANEFLIRHGPESLRTFVENDAKEWPVVGIYGLSQIPEPAPLEIWKLGFAAWEGKLALAPTILSVVTGNPGHGKTVLTAQIWFQIARDYGINVAVASFETRAKPHHRRNLRQFMFGRQEVTLSEEEKHEADKWNDDHFRWLIHPNRHPTLRWIMEMAEVAVVRHNVKALVIDPWNRLDNDRPPDMRETDWIGICLDELIDFARDMNVHVQIVTHPSKSQDFKQRQQAPRLEDIHGSKNWDNRADIGLSIYRPELFKDGIRKTEASLYVLKVRHDELGHPCRLDLDYRIDEGRFVSTDRGPGVPTNRAYGQD